jgi:hypothetical protein
MWANSVKAYDASDMSTFILGMNEKIYQGAAGAALIEMCKSATGR